MQTHGRLAECCQNAFLICREIGGPNLGITLFRSKKNVIELVKQWLDLRGEGVWDQNMFKKALEQSARAHPDLQIQVQAHLCGDKQDLKLLKILHQEC